MNDPHLLIAGLHRRALLAVSNACGTKQQGLSVAARQLGLSPRWKRKLRDLDTILGMVEKVSQQSCSQWMVDLEHELSDVLGKVPPPPSPIYSSLASDTTSTEAEPSIFGGQDDKSIVQHTGDVGSLCSLDQWLFDASSTPSGYSCLPSTTASVYIGDDEPCVETTAVSHTDGMAQTEWTIYHESNILLPTPMQAVMLGLQALDAQTNQQIQSLCDNHATMCLPPYDATGSCVMAETQYLEAACSTSDLQLGTSSTKVLWADTKYKGQLVVKAFCAWWKAHHQLSARSNASSVFQMPKTATGNRFDKLEVTRDDDDSSAPEGPIECISSPKTATTGDRLTDAQQQHWEDYCRFIDHLREAKLRSAPTRDVDGSLLRQRIMEMMRRVPQSMAPMVLELIESLHVKDIPP